MKKIITFAKRYGASVAIIFLALPQFVVAQQNCPPGGSCLNNPLGYTSVTQFVASALRAFVYISLPILAVFIVLAGFRFILARGKPEALVLAKWNFAYVLIGTTLILGAWVFANLIGATITSISTP